jgi:hypothetical protein
MVHQIARYRILDLVERGSGTCRVIDWSEIGAGLLLAGPPWPRYPSEWRLRLEFEARFAVDLLNGGRERVACVRNTTLTDLARVRLGVEFLE